MPRLRLSRLIPALLLLAAIFFAFRRNSFQLTQKNEFASERSASSTTLEDSRDETDSEGDVEGQFVRRIVAVGDLHGDYPNALKVLQMSHVVDAQGNWTGDVDFFVQTGDIIDR